MYLQGHSTGMTAQVISLAQKRPSYRAECIFHVSGLAGTHLHNNARLMLQFWDVLRDPARVREAIRAPVEVNHGIIVTDVGLKRRYLVRCNIRWVLNDQIQGSHAT